VKNESGEVSSEKTQLIVTPAPPVIISQPNDVSIDMGESANFSVTVRGSEPLDYQWYKNGLAIENGTMENLDIPNVSKDDITIYSVRIKNQFGKAISNIAELKLNEPKTTKTSLSLPTIDSSGNLSLIANGPPNKKVIFQFSNDLKNWEDQLTVPLNEGKTTLNPTLHNSIGSPNVFYRLKLAE